MTFSCILAKQLLYNVRLFIFLGFGINFLYLNNLAHAQPTNGTEAIAPSIELVQERMNSISSSSSLEETVKSTLQDQYSGVLDALRLAAEHRLAADAYQQALQTANTEAETIRNQIAAQGADPISDLGVTAQSSSELIENELQLARTSLSTLELTQRQLDGRIAEQDSRQQTIRSRQEDIQNEISQLLSNFPDRSATSSQPNNTEAQLWNQQAKLDALNAETTRLQLEVRSAPARLLLLTATRDRLLVNFARTSAKIQAMTGWLADNRRTQTEQVIAETSIALPAGTRSNLLILEVLAENERLARDLAEKDGALSRATADNAEAANQLIEVRQRLDNTRQQLDIGSMSQALGRYLAEERRALAQLSNYPNDSRKRQIALSEAGLHGIRLDQTRRNLFNPHSLVESLLENYDGNDIADVQAALFLLVESRRDLVQQSIAVNQDYLQTISELEYQESQRYVLLEEFNELLAQELLWVRNGSTLSLSQLQELPHETRGLFDPAWWASAFNGIVWQVTNTSTLMWCLFFFGLFLWKRRTLRQSLTESSKRVGKPSEDTMEDTFSALFTTFALTAPWSGLVWIFGFSLSGAVDSTEPARIIGIALQQLSPLLFFIMFFRELCVRKGVAESHLQLTPTAVRQLRKNFSSLLVTFAVPAFLMIVHLETGIAGPDSILIRLLFLLLLVSLGIFLFRLLKPAGGIAYGLKRKQARFVQIRGWYWLSMAQFIPAGLALMVVIGYTYSAGLLLEKLLATLWLLFGLILLRELIVRWLLIARRRLLLRKALAYRAAAKELTQTEGNEPSDTSEAFTEQNPAVDIKALDGDTRTLVSTTLFVTGLLFLGSIWSPVLTAFSFFADVILWETHQLIEEQQILTAVTLYDVVKAIMIGVVTVAAVRHAPSLVEITLRQRASISPGSRLAFATLARYAIAVFGIVWSISLLGVDWSKAQWLVAALGVGIGFGLQEIVANFISGLVILMERPIRVGDVVTVGDASGTVTQIRIRATTIRTFDRQELLVPNKEFITGRVLNWTLSDDMIRIYFNVGVAYGSDVELALKLLEQVAIDHPTTLDDPAPMVTFEGFGDNTMILGLRCYVASINDRLATTTDLHKAINTEYIEAGIDIAVPQRDIHLDTISPLEIRVLQGTGTINNGQNSKVPN